MKRLLLIVAVSACEPVKVIKDIRPVASLFPKQEWADHAIKEVVMSDLLNVDPKDANEFCMKGMDAAGWVVLLSAMAKLESGFNPSLEYKENFKNSKGQYVISTGLLQLSLESSRGYGCPMNSQADLKDPKKNISCGIKILEKWLLSDRVISGKSGSTWIGGARYWSVLRYKTSEIKKLMHPYCS